MNTLLIYHRIRKPTAICFHGNRAHRTYIDTSAAARTFFFFQPKIFSFSLHFFSILLSSSIPCLAITILHYFNPITPNYFIADYFRRNACSKASGWNILCNYASGSDNCPVSNIDSL